MSPGEPPVAEFEAPWQARVFAMAEQLRRAGHLDWTDFQRRIARRTEPAGTPGYGDWVAVLEELLVEDHPPRS